MKKTILAMMTLALAFGVSSCAKEKTNNAYIPTGEKALITIDVQGSGTDTRVVGNPTDNTDSDINSLGIFVFAGNGDADACLNKFNIALPLTAGKTGDLSTTDNSKYIFVVANAGDISNATNALNSIINVGDLKAALADMGDPTQTSGNVLMTSADLVALSPFTGTPKRATATATLEFVGAKLTIRWDEGTAFANASGNWTFDLFVNQANAKAPFFGNAAARSDVSAAGYYSALATTANPSSATNVIAATLTDVGVAKQTFCHYYAFGNDAVAKATIIGVAARNGVTSVVRYFTLHFNGIDAGGRTLVSGSSYEITIKLKGDLDNTTTPPGTGEPEEEVNPADIEVTITPAAWGPRIVLDKEV